MLRPILLRNLSSVPNHQVHMLQQWRSSKMVDTMRAVKPRKRSNVSYPLGLGTELNLRIGAPILTCLCWSFLFSCRLILIVIALCSTIPLFKLATQDNYVSQLCSFQVPPSPPISSLPLNLCSRTTSNRRSDTTAWQRCYHVATVRIEKISLFSSLYFIYYSRDFI